MKVMRKLTNEDAFITDLLNRVATSETRKLRGVESGETLLVLGFKLELEDEKQAKDFADNLITSSVAGELNSPINNVKLANALFESGHGDQLTSLIKDSKLTGLNTANLKVNESSGPFGAFVHIGFSLFYS